MGRFPRDTHPSATKAEAFVRLACVRHAASVRSEPGSNSQIELQTKLPKDLRCFSGTSSQVVLYPAHCWLLNYALAMTRVFFTRRRPRISSINPQCQTAMPKKGSYAATKFRAPPEGPVVPEKSSTKCRRRPS